MKSSEEKESDIKKRLGKVLFTREGLNQKECAERCKVTEKTFGKWVKKYKWESLRTSLSISNDQILQDLQAQVNEINNNISQRDEGKKYATPAEADSRHKTIASIKALQTELGIAESVEVFQKFGEFLSIHKPELLKIFVELQDEYIKSIIK